MLAYTAKYTTKAMIMNFMAMAQKSDEEMIMCFYIHGRRDIV